MRKEELISMLSAKNDCNETIKWLRLKYLPEIIQLFNSEESRKRFGLYQGEKIPTNERNLTDVRTRMGVLIEFELARISNQFLEENKISDIFWSYVVANRFPDLEIRSNDGERHLRLEIKTLQCVAEEKSANFDTLLKDINPNTDFVVVFLWDWDSTLSENYKWDSAPIIFNAFVFNAYTLALLRDTYWLNNPPSNLGNGFQGFDLRYAVTCTDGVYSKEQGNYGKLTRIWKKDFPYLPHNAPLLNDTIEEYFIFQDEIISTGFKLIAYNHLKQITNNAPSKEIIEQGHFFKSQNIAYFLSKTISVRQAKEISVSRGISVFVVMTEKYRSSIYRVVNGESEKLASDEKPKNALKIMLSLREN